jgi:hypothetical protein
MLAPIRFFCGVCALWVPDRKGEQFMPGCFARSIAIFDRGRHGIQDLERTSASFKYDAALLEAHNPVYARRAK